MLKGVVRIEQLRQADEYIEALLGRVKPEYIRKHYGIKSWDDAVDFLEQYARKIGKLLKGGEADVNAAAKLMLHDFQRGRLPYFTLPPGTPADEAATAYNSREAGKEKSEEIGAGGARVQRQSLKQLVTTHDFVAEDEDGSGSEEEGEEEEEDEGE